ncbi:hypothetical protein [Paraherbaspirillum soli]|uniref:Uncharacterized protein n=1 Tax=Paraherbaspirillum soli TaxID=631222 RepID=A0ABW0M367_9BURK
MHQPRLSWLVASALISCCSYGSAQSCSLYFTSPAKNSVFRTADVNITAAGRPQVWLNNWHGIGVIQKHIYGIPDNDMAYVSEFAPLPSPMPFFDASTEYGPVRLFEGRNEFMVEGWIHRKWPAPICYSSDSIRLFYIKPNDLCYAMVEALDKIPQPEKDSTNGFVINQRCIAKYSCGSRPQMKDKTWLTKVVPAFVRPFLDKSGKWNEVMQACGSQWEYLPSYVKKKRCEDKMAEYHIEQDLQKALNENGCGTDRDWDEVGAYINECVAEQNGIIPTFFASKVIAATRNKIRTLCQASRSKS